MCPSPGQHDGRARHGRGAGHCFLRGINPGLRRMPNLHSLSPGWSTCFSLSFLRSFTFVQITIIYLTTFNNPSCTSLSPPFSLLASRSRPLLRPFLITTRCVHHKILYTADLDITSAESPHPVCRCEECYSRRAVRGDRIQASDPTHSDRACSRPRVHRMAWNEQCKLN